MLHEWTTEDAARLIAMALKPKANPTKNKEYASLLRLMTDDAEFRTQVESIATGLGLRIYEANDYYCVLGVTDKDSVFAHKIGELREHFGDVDKTALLIVMTAVVVAFFPTAESLENEDYRRGEFLTLADLLDLLDQYIAESSKQTQDEELNEMFAKGWRYLRELPVRTPNEQRMSKKSREGLLRHVLYFFDEQGFVKIESVEDQLRVFLKHRFRVHAKELLNNHLFLYLVDINKDLNFDAPDFEGVANA